MGPSDGVMGKFGRRGSFARSLSGQSKISNYLKYKKKIIRFRSKQCVKAGLLSFTIAAEKPPRPNLCKLVDSWRHALDRREATDCEGARLPLRTAPALRGKANMPRTKTPRTARTVRSVFCLTDPAPTGLDSTKRRVATSCCGIDVARAMTRRQPFPDSLIWRLNDVD